MIVIAFLLFIVTIVFYRKITKDEVNLSLVKSPWPDLSLFLAFRSQDNRHSGVADNLSYLFKLKKVVFERIVLSTSSSPNFFEDFKGICIDSRNQFGLLIDIKDVGTDLYQTSKRLYLETRIVNSSGDLIDTCIDEIYFDIKRENEFWQIYVQNYISRIKLIRDKENRIINLRLNYLGLVKIA